MIFVSRFREVDILGGVVLPFEGFPDEFEDLAEGVGEFGGLDNEGLGAVGEANTHKIPARFDGCLGVIELGRHKFSRYFCCFRLKEVGKFLEEGRVDRESANARIVFFLVGIPFLEDLDDIFGCLLVHGGEESDDFLSVELLLSVAVGLSEPFRALVGEDALFLSRPLVERAEFGEEATEVSRRALGVLDDGFGRPRDIAEFVPRHADDRVFADEFLADDIGGRALEPRLLRNAIGGCGTQLEERHIGSSLLVRKADGFERGREMVHMKPVYRSFNK